MNSKVVISADIYKEFTHREHIYKIPDTYIGSVRPIERIEWVLKSNGNIISTIYPPPTSTSIHQI